MTENEAKWHILEGFKTRRTIYLVGAFVAFSSLGGRASIVSLFLIGVFLVEETYRTLKETSK